MTSVREELFGEINKKVLTLNDTWCYTMKWLFLDRCAQKRSDQSFSKGWKEDLT